MNISRHSTSLANYDYASDRTCRADGCTALIHSGGVCKIHYARFRRNGIAGLKTRVVVTDEMRDEIRARYRRLESMTSIGRAVGVSVDVVRRTVGTKP